MATVLQQRANRGERAVKGRRIEHLCSVRINDFLTEAEDRGRYISRCFVIISEFLCQIINVILVLMNIWCRGVVGYHVSLTH